jgi:hypothetical protein
MTKEQLRAWRDRHFGLHGNRNAAHRLGLSIDQFQKRLYGSVKIDRTLELLCEAIAASGSDHWGEALKRIHVIARNPRHCSESAWSDIDGLVRDALRQPEGPVEPAVPFIGEAWAEYELWKRENDDVG